MVLRVCGFCRKEKGVQNPMNWNSHLQACKIKKTKLTVVLILNSFLLLLVQI
jgi:hypothetical protein